jgi:hypothetical protein
MPPFEYQPYRNVYAQSLADLMMQGGQAQAQGLQAAGQEIAQGQRGAGQAWGQMLSGLGTTIGELPQQQQQAQLRQAQMQDLAAQAQVRAAEVRDLQRKESGRQAMAATLPTYTTYDATGKPVIDNEGFANDLITQGFTDEGRAWTKSAAENAKDLETLADSKRTHDLKVAQTFGDLAFNANSQPEFEAGVTRAVALGLLDPNQAKTITDTLNSPNGWDTLRNNLVQYSPEWLDQQKELRKIREVPKESALVTLAPPAGGVGTPTATTLVAAQAKPGTMEDWVSRWRKMATDAKGQPLTDPETQAVDTKAIEAFKLASTEPSTAAALERQAIAERFMAEQQGRTQAFTEAQAGRSELTNKVEQPYLDAREKAQTIRNVVQAARGGNMEAASVQSLLGTLGLITAEGVKRINTTELEQVAGAGDLFTRIRGQIGRLTAGQPLAEPLPTNLIGLADLLDKGAYEKYASGFARTTGRYGLKDERPLPAPSPALTTPPDKEGDVKPVPGHPGQTAVYKNGRWVIP